MESKNRGVERLVPLKRVYLNPWNPNEQSPAEYAAVKAALMRHGQVAPIVVRGHPDKGKGRFQVIDGEHRVKAMRDLSWKEVIVHDLGEMSEAMAKQLNVILTEARGQSDVRKLGRLIEELGAEELEAVLPFDDEELEEYHCHVER